MWSWATSTIQTYRSRLSLLAQREATLPGGASAGVVVQTVLLETLAAGSPASSLRVVLSAVQCTVTLGLCDFAIPPAWWRLSSAATRLAIRPAGARDWFHLEALGPIASRPLGDNEVTVLGLTILALSLGLRVGEAAGLGPSASIRVFPEKQRPTNFGCVYRTPPPFALAWAAFLLRRADAVGHRGPFLDRAALALGFRDLQARAGVSVIAFHSLRRACASYMLGQGHTLTAIAHWCRWRSDRMAEHYAGDRDTTSACTVPLPGPPEGTAAPWLCPVYHGDASCLWHPPAAVGVHPGRPDRPRKGKRPRVGGPHPHAQP